MTEGEAKRKWCPMKRLEGGNFRPKNPRDGVDTYCITSDCMMWKETNNGIPDGQSAPSKKSGYCGLAK